MLDAVSTSETSVDFHQTTWRNTSEDSHPQHVRRMGSNRVQNQIIANSARGKRIMGAPKIFHES
jgi:hypothetical protein